MKDKPLKSQFRFTIVLIVLSSLLATIVTYGTAVLIFEYLLSKEQIYPANHYEAQIPNIVSYIQQENVALLDKDAQLEVEQVIPIEGIDYQVYDAMGNLLYGSMDEPFVEHSGELFQRLNTTFTNRGKFVRVVPIVHEKGDFSGAVSLAYELHPTAVKSSGRLWIVLLAMVIIVAPFVYFVLAIIFFSKRFTNHINEPLQLLMDAAHHIKQKNLDFDLNYRADNELGQLCAAFSEMKDELQKSLSAQWKMEDARRTMTEALAHDLKTPLSLILGYSEALLKDDQKDTKDKQYRYIKIIHDHAEKSAALVRQMLYISDLENSTVKLMPVSIHIETFVQQKVSDYELQAKQQGIQFLTEIRGNTDAPIYVDADKVERIFDNIVSNSLEHTPKGGQIRIQVEVQANKVNVVIGNTGPRFTEKDLKHMFDRFYRGEDARGSKGNHSGLGLYIVKQLVEMLGGTVQAYNSESGEACINFDFPFSPANLAIK